MLMEEIKVDKLDEYRVRNKRELTASTYVGASIVGWLGIIGFLVSIVLLIIEISKFNEPSSASKDFGTFLISTPVILTLGFLMLSVIAYGISIILSAISQFIPHVD
jgi:hypothetical protein